MRFISYLYENTLGKMHLLSCTLKKFWHFLLDFRLCRIWIILADSNVNSLFITSLWDLVKELGVMVTANSHNTKLRLYFSLNNLLLKFISNGSCHFLISIFAICQEKYSHLFYFSIVYSIKKILKGTGEVCASTSSQTLNILDKFCMRFRLHFNDITIKWKGYQVNRGLGLLLILKVFLS